MNNSLFGWENTYVDNNTMFGFPEGERADLIYGFPNQMEVDYRAELFIKAAGLTESKEKLAAYYLVYLLKKFGLWDKMTGIYPFIGGTSDTHKWNLKDPVDSNSSFRLTFPNGATHSKTGVDWNGTTQYAETYINPLLHLPQNSVHVSYYSREDVNSLTCDIGCSDISVASCFLSIFSRDSNFFQGEAPFTFIRTANTDSRGFFISTRSTNVLHSIYKNGINFGNNTNSSIPNPNITVHIGRYNRTSGSTVPTSRQCAFASIGKGLSDTDAYLLNTAVQYYNQILNRKV